MNRRCATIVCLLALPPGAFAQKRTMVDNLNYRASWGDLGNVAPAPLEKLRSLRLAAGGDHLLESCLTNPQKWHRDPLYFRFGHKHPFSTIGCRERTSPSLHVVFYKMDDGSRQAWIHFDLYSPGNFIGHAGEVVQNRLTFGRTSQADVYRSLVSFRGDPNHEIPAPRYDFRAHAREYLKTTFGPSALASSIATGGAGAFIDLTTEFGSGFERYANHVESNLARHTIQQTIEFGAAAFLKQDESFAVSHEQRISRRVKAALYHSFFVPGRNGDEFAFPRLAAAVGTSWITREWHPWRREPIDPWRQSSLILSSYVLRSFWQEFKPDIKNRLRSRARHFAKHDDSDHLISLSTPTTCSAHCK